MCPINLDTSKISETIYTCRLVRLIYKKIGEKIIAMLKHLKFKQWLLKEVSHMYTDLDSRAYCFYCA